MLAISLRTQGNWVKKSMITSLEIQSLMPALFRRGGTLRAQAGTHAFGRSPKRWF